MTDQPSHAEGISKAALAAVRRGYQPIPIATRSKLPALSAWTRIRWDANNLDEVKEKFAAWRDEDMSNIGLLLGEPSGGLVDVDLDHPRTMRLKDFFLPPTPMRSGRDGRRNSHYWYQVEEGTLTGTRRYKMPDKAVSVELRSTRAQTVIPPSIHPSGENYRWEGRAWGGKEGPARVNGRVLAVQVATLGLTAVLLDNWPRKGSRHDAYLALAGGLLRYGTQGVHPYWERNVAVLIHALAEATHDEDGGHTRVAETVPTTINRLRSGDGLVAGFGRLAEIIGDDHVTQVRAMVREVEREAGFIRQESDEPSPASAAEVSLEEDLGGEHSAERDPLAERKATWEPVDLEPYLAQEIAVRPPEVMQRSDGMHLMYGGRVNMLFGSSETAKSWIALAVCLQEMARAGNVMYLDFEDEPENTLARLFALSAGVDDIRKKFTYIRPEEPHAEMQRSRWGQPAATDRGRLNRDLLEKAVNESNPSFIVVDGMTVLYGLHGLDTNDASGTEVITGWLKRLTRNGMTTVLLIDHAPKGSIKGSLPIGSQHKQAMVQGTLLQVWPLSQPMPGSIGRVELITLKDRPGLVRKVSEKSGDSDKVQLSAVVTLDSTHEDGHTDLLIDPPSPGAVSKTQLQVDLEHNREAARKDAARIAEQHVLDVFGGDLDLALTRDEVIEALPDLPPGTVRSALNRLADPNRKRDARTEPVLGKRPRHDGAKRRPKEEFFLLVGTG